MNQSHENKQRPYYQKIITKIVISPAPIGIITILVMSTTIDQKSMDTYSPANIIINNGVINGAIIVPTAVSVTDKAKLAFAKYDMTLDAKPLGQLPIRITPAAISGGKENTLVSDHPAIGIMLY